MKDMTLTDLALVVDDHPVTHLGCRGLLVELGFAEVAKAETESAALRFVDTRQPGLILLDLGLPGVGGLKLLPQLIARAPQTPILVFTMNENPAFAVMALEQGAHGFLSKNAAPEEFLRAVRTVMQGQVFLEPALALSVAKRTARGGSVLSQLNAREIQILRLIGQGLTYDEIAREVHVSYKTVANVSSVLRQKLSVKSLPELMRVSLELNADRHGLDDRA